MKSKILYTLLIITLSGLLAWAVLGYKLNSKVSEVEGVVQSVCLTSGYDNWYKVQQNPNGSYTVWCFNYDWETVNFEM